MSYFGVMSSLFALTWSNCGLFSCSKYELRASNLLGCLTFFKFSVVVKVQVQNRGVGDIRSLQQTIEDLQNRTKPRSHQNEKLISELKEEGIEILSSRVDRKTAIVWIWCQSQAAIETIKKLYVSNKLTDALVDLACIRSSTSEINQSFVINIDEDELKKTVGKLTFIKGSLNT